MSREFRLNKFIALATGCSRRDAEDYILSGLVKVAGKRVNNLSVKVCDADIVTLKGKKLKLPKYYYYIMNKPPGYITSRKDEKGRKTIYDLLPDKIHKLKPAGRLDRASSGLILLTNDGELINLLTHPSSHVPKKYKITIRGKFTSLDAKSFAEGIDIGDGQIACAEVLYFVKKAPQTMELLLVLYQGYNRQIRRMINKVGAEVVSLKRLSIGPLTLKNLKRGAYSPLSKKEVRNLFEYIANNKASELSEKCLSR